MIDVQVSAVIPRSVEDVFGYVANIENWPKWQSTVTDIQRMNPGPDGVGLGSRYRYVAQAEGQRFPATLTITEYRPHETIAFESDWAGPIQPQGQVHFEAVPGGTKVTVRMRPRTRGMLRWIEPRLARGLHRLNEKSLHRLAAEMTESGAHP